MHQHAKYEGADRVRGMGEKRGREGGEEGEGGGRRGGGRREKRGREEGEEGAGGGRGEEEREGEGKRKFLRARIARRSRREEGDEGREGGGKGAGGGRGLPPCPPPQIWTEVSISHSLSYSEGLKVDNMQSQRDGKNNRPSL